MSAWNKLDANSLTPVPGADLKTNKWGLDANSTMEMANLDHHNDTQALHELVAAIDEVNNGESSSVGQKRPGDKFSLLHASNFGVSDLLEAPDSPGFADENKHTLANLHEDLQRDDIGRDGLPHDPKAQQALLDKDDDLDIDTPEVLEPPGCCTRFKVGCTTALGSKFEDHACSQHTSAACSFLCGEMSRNPVCGPMFQAMSHCLGLTGRAEALFEMTSGVLEPMVDIYIYIYLSLI